MRRATNEHRSIAFMLQRLSLCLLLWGLGLALSVPLSALAEDGPPAGPLFDEFDLTLAPGHRTEALGPFFYSEEEETQRAWAVPPLLSYTRDPATESKEFDFLYPVMTYDRYGEQYRWQFFQVLSFAGGPTQRETARDRFTLFPLYFQQRSSDPNENYTAVFPFYGHLKHRLFRDDIFFAMFPLYSETRKKDVVTDNYLWPLFSLRHGEALHGWKAWPLVGNEHKDVTTRTNGFGDVTTNGGHDSFFALWPLFFNTRSGIGTTNEQWQQASIPAYSVLRSPPARLDHRYLALLQLRGRPGEEIPRVGRALAAGRVRPRRGQAHVARLAVLQPRDTTRRWRAISGCGRFTSTTGCIRPRSTAGAPGFASSFTPTWRRRTPRPRQCGGGLISGHSSTHHRDFNGNSRLQVACPARTLHARKQGH